MSEIILDRAAYAHNLAQIAAKVGGVERVFLVAKDNSYGHGCRLCCEEAAKLGFVRAVTRSAAEAAQIADLFDEILVLSHIPSGDEDERFCYAVNDLSYFSRLKRGLKIYITADTAMHRNGISASELDEALRLCKAGGFKLRGFFTHFRASDELSGDFFAQRQNFIEFKRLARQKAAAAGFRNLKFHSSNSAAIERSAGFEDEYVRVGMAQFGYPQFDESLNLHPVLKLYADLISSRVLKKGERVGYGAKFEAPRDMRIGTYDLGYADGLFRYDGEGELALASGQKMLGKMSMDSFCAEFSGERICVLDDARAWAKHFGTIEYEILVKLNSNIPRRFQ